MCGACQMQCLTRQLTQLHSTCVCWICVATGCRTHSWAASVADRLPVQSLFSYLGQGFAVVLSGHGFGGLVAHAVATRLLLQLRQEINMAKELGINLSVLGQTESKVCVLGPEVLQIAVSWLDVQSCIMLGPAIAFQWSVCRCHHTRSAPPCWSTRILLTTCEHKVLPAVCIPFGGKGMPARCFSPSAATW